MAGWSRFVLGHKRLVLLFWLVCLVPAVLGTMQVGGRLSADTAMPGEPGYQANQEILRRYGTGGAKEPLVPVVGLPAGLTVDSPALGQAFDALARHTGLLDATLVRAVLVPALVTLFGRANWWLPGRRISRGRSDDAAGRSPAPRRPAGAAR
jgi:uncharacterized membrane protein YdfJ with MMPL/SSD domain